MTQLRFNLLYNQLNRYRIESVTNSIKIQFEVSDMTQLRFNSRYLIQFEVSDMTQLRFNLLYIQLNKYRIESVTNSIKIQFEVSDMIQLKFNPMYLI